MVLSERLGRTMRWLVIAVMSKVTIPLEGGG